MGKDAALDLGCAMSIREVKDGVPIGAQVKVYATKGCIIDMCGYTLENFCEMEVPEQESVTESITDKDYKVSALMKNAGAIVLRNATGAQEDIVP